MKRAEFAEWRAYYELEPWGQERADMRAALIAALHFNARHAGKATKPTDWMAVDFLPLLAQEEARKEGAAPSAAQQRRVALLLRERFRALAGVPLKTPAKGT